MVAVDVDCCRVTELLFSKVVDQVLKDPSVSDKVILNRAKVRHCTLPSLDAPKVRFRNRV